MAYVCEKAVGAAKSCDFRSGKIILQQEIPRDEMQKLLATGKTSLLKGFVSNKTRRKFSAFLVRDAATGKVAFEFEPRAAKAGAKTAAKPAADVAQKVGAGDTATKVAKPVAKPSKTPAKRAAKKTSDKT
jgi:DNA topoisomerase-3